MDDFQIVLYAVAIIIFIFSVVSIFLALQSQCPPGENKICVRDWDGHISCFCVKKIIGGD